MTDGNGQWEREIVARLATAALKEQRRARLWGIFFKLLTFAYVTLILIMTVDWQARTDLAGGKKPHRVGRAERGHRARRGRERGKDHDRAAGGVSRTRTLRA
jgi:hypothetical protein